jgi:formyl-CoA transferase
MESSVLASVKVVEFAQFVAGPLAGSLLADLGADVIHVEQPNGGDATRQLGPARDGVHLAWKVTGRNKRSVTLDLRSSQGQELARDLVRWADVVITNFRFETLVDWGLDWKTLHGLNSRLVMLQVSGYGATSSLRNEPGYGKLGEARSGAVYVQGHKDGPPILPGFSLGDSVTALMGSFAICAALVGRDEADFQGEWIDLALFESLYRLNEWQVIYFDQLGIVPERRGNRGGAGSNLVNLYMSADGDWITVTSGTVRSVQVLAELVGESVDDYSTVERQVDHVDQLDELVRRWVLSRPGTECLTEMLSRGVVASRVFSVADIVADSVYNEREDVVTVDDPELGPVKMQGVIPKLHVKPGSVWRTGPKLGEDNDLIYGTWLGRSEQDLEDLRKSGVI